ncbi:uncharacterized protein TNIN_440741 [Trichonephila inaurata madagascariensis]|uniref:Uncharacterized protein n=1 Tax=Trichonephila inaurata madagascariensis TaxID=2747483 RepID=A0A8X6Y8C6_9ARAC|nr:uncharacterized protein TNIN_440741 [Trichonephila inaurata madagascariensis]
MIRLPIQVLVLSVIAVSSVVALKGFDDDFISYNKKTDMCISQSGDQKLCDDLVACNYKGPKKIATIFEKCVSENLPGGTLGKCNDTDTLFGKSDVFNKYFQCLLDHLPQKSSLSDEDKNLFDNYKQCIYKQGDKCFRIQECKVRFTL